MGGEGGRCALSAGLRGTRRGSCQGARRSTSQQLQKDDEDYYGSASALHAFVLAHLA